MGVEFSSQKKPVLANHNLGPGMPPMPGKLQRKSADYSPLSWKDYFDHKLMMKNVFIFF